MNVFTAYSFGAVLKSPVAIIFFACLFEVLSLLALSSYPSLIPVLQAEWRLSNAQAGTINGLFFAGKLTTVTIVSTLSDRFNARGMYLAFLALGGLAALAFSFFATGFWSAAGLRFLEGAAVGGTYIPGLKILTDNVPERYRSRATSFYTACYFLAAGLSFFLALNLLPEFGWRRTIAICGAGPMLAFLIATFVLPRIPRSTEPPARLFDMRAVTGNKRAVGFSLLYAIHNIEFTAFASWLVPFLAFAQSQAAPIGAAPHSDLAMIAAMATIVALPASIAGNELAHKMSRQIWITVVTLTSAATAVMLGLSAQWTFGLVLAMAFAYSTTIAADSSAITGGVIQVAETGRKGGTLALYSFIGFIGAALGPILFGVALDLGGGEARAAGWVAGFSTIAAFCLLQPIIIWRMIGGPPIRG